MRNTKVTFEDFEIEKLSKNQQKTVHGGGDNEPIDPSKGTGKGNG
ncbi:rSAM-modified peptide [Flavobacterium sp.]